MNEMDRVELTDKGNEYVLLREWTRAVEALEEAAERSIEVNHKLTQVLERLRGLTTDKSLAGSMLEDDDVQYDENDEVPYEHHLDAFERCTYLTDDEYFKATKGDAYLNECD